MNRSHCLPSKMLRSTVLSLLFERTYAIVSSFAFVMGCFFLKFFRNFFPDVFSQYSIQGFSRIGSQSSMRNLLSFPGISIRVPPGIFADFFHRISNSFQFFSRGFWRNSSGRIQQNSPKVCSGIYLCGFRKSLPTVSPGFFARFLQNFP